jgi:hypothetical protein
MEFGESPPAPGGYEPPPGSENLGDVDGELLEFELGVDSETEPPEVDVKSVGFELEEEGAPFLASEHAEEPVDASLDDAGDAMSFSEDEVSFSEEEPEIELGVGGSEVEAEEEFVLGTEGEEIDLVPEDEVFLLEEFESEVETEPEMAADGAESLVGLLGDDIDSLIDSIIDDVGDSTSSTPAPASAPPTAIPLFSDLTAAEFVEIAVMLVRRPEKAGSVIVREGDPGDSMFIVSTGEVLATCEEGGRQRELARLCDGDFFGEMALLSGEPRSATVTAMKNTELLELSRHDLHKIFSRHPEVEAKIRWACDQRSERNRPKG